MCDLQVAGGEDTQSLLRGVDLLELGIVVDDLVSLALELFVEVLALVRATSSNELLRATTWSTRQSVVVHHTPQWTL